MCIFNSKIAQFFCGYYSIVNEFVKISSIDFFWLTGFATKYQDEVGSSLELAIHFDTSNSLE